MLNQIVVVGRITKVYEIEEEEKKSTYLNIAVPRSYKNANGEYDTDFLKVKLYNGIATNVVEYCKVGDLIGIKGRLQGEIEKMEIIAEKVSFLSSKKGNEDED